MDNYESDLADVVNYPDVRIFSASLEWSNKPQYDLISADINWASPTSGKNICMSYFYLSVEYRAVTTSVL